MGQEVSAIGVPLKADATLSANTLNRTLHDDISWCANWPGRSVRAIATRLTSLAVMGVAGV